jgi:hypothetical protein
MQFRTEHTYFAHSTRCSQAKWTPFFQCIPPAATVGRIFAFSPSDAPYL